MNDAVLSGVQRGRSAGNTADTRERILAATRHVYGEFGVHGSTVQLILKRAGISRPTFYKYFSSALDVIEEVVLDCNRQAEALFAQVFAQPQNEFYDYLPVALSSYLNWGRAQESLMTARFRELHDRASPVAKYRREHNQRIQQTIRVAIERHGRRVPSPLELTALVQGIEFMGYQYCINADHTEMPAYLEVMSRLSIAMLGNGEDWQAMLDSPFYSRLLGLKR